MKYSSSFVRKLFGRRIIVLFVICSLLPVCVFALGSLYTVSSRLENDSNERLRQAGKNAGMTLLEGLGQLQTELESAPLSAQSADKRPAARRVGTERFRTVHARTYDAGTGVIAGFSRPLSRAAIGHLSDENALLLVETELGAGEPMYMATAANRNLSPQSLVIGEINPEYLWTLVGYTVTRGIDISIVAPSGKTLYASRPFAAPLIANVLAQRKISATGQFEWPEEDSDYLVNYWSAFMQPTLLTDAWVVVAIQSKKDSLGPIHEYAYTFSKVIFLTVFIVILASNRLINNSLGPLKKLRDGADRLKRGDFTSRVPKESDDEFGDLADAFNNMSDELGKREDDLQSQNRDTIAVLANTVDAKSPWTAGHSQRVTQLAQEIGKIMRLSEKDLDLLEKSGWLHDIGKIGTPEAIIDKPGSLTKEEYAEIKKHPEKGADILKSYPAFHAVIPIVRQHHEQFDGGGYPLGLAGEEIVPGARILAVADVFDALHSSRPYRPGWELTTVIEYLEEHAGSKFDPEVVAAFRKVNLTQYLETTRPELEQR